MAQQIISLLIGLHTLALAIAVSGCAGMLPVARTSGATFTDDGVHLAVIGQRCVQVADASRPGKRSLDATFEIEVGNPARGTVIVHPSRMVLMVPGGVAIETISPEASEPVPVETGITVPFRLRFVAAGVGCSQELRLEPGTALESRGQPIPIPAIRFVPVGAP